MAKRCLDEKVCFGIGFELTNLCDLLWHSMCNGFEQKLYEPFLHKAHWHEIALAIEDQLIQLKKIHMNDSVA